MISFAHIINPVAAPEGSELGRVQPITYETMRRAAQQAKNVVNVSLIAAVFPDETHIIPQGFQYALLPDRALNDVVAGARRLPYLEDILETGIINSSSDFIIYSNSDIALMPDFYLRCAELISAGADAFCINRRRISGHYSNVSQLDQMYHESGLPHPGFDTFVFQRSKFPSYVLNRVAVGLPYVDMALVHNLIAFSGHFRLIATEHLTFHIGKELVKNWGGKPECEYNYTRAVKTVNDLKPYYRIENFPGSGLGFLKRHYMWLFNPNYNYPTMLWLDFRQLLNKRRKPGGKCVVNSESGKYEQLICRITPPDLD